MALGYLLWGAAHAAVGWTAYEGDLELGTPLAAATMVGPLLLGPLRYPAGHPSPHRRIRRSLERFTGRRSSDCCSPRSCRSGR